METYWTTINTSFYDINSNVTTFLLRLEELKRKTQFFWTEGVLSIFDLDDTLYSREEQLKNPLLAENRWKKWNEIILTELWWYDQFVDDYYFTWWITQEFVWMVKEESSLILTAWEFELQMRKIIKLWLDRIKRIIVDDSKEKPLALFKHILSKFEKIPERIVIYDDRVKYLLEKAQILSNLFWVEIEINEVKLKWNEVEQLEKIIFIPKQIEHADMMLALYSLND